MNKLILANNSYDSNIITDKSKLLKNVGISWISISFFYIILVSINYKYFTILDLKLFLTKFFFFLN